MLHESRAATLNTVGHLALAFLLLLVPLASRGQEQDTVAPTRKNTQEQRERAIHELTHGDFAAREAASEFLWQCGLATKPLLEGIVSKGNPEGATRARAILQRFAKKDIGKLPPDRVGLLAVVALKAQQDPRGAVYSLLRENPTEREMSELFAAIPDLSQRRLAVSSLSSNVKYLVQLAREEGIERAESFIETAAASGHPDGVRRWVSYLVVTERAEEVRESLEKKAAAGKLGRSRLPLLSALRYATGDHDKALELAERIDYADVKLSVLLRRGDWIAVGEAIAETIPIPHKSTRLSVRLRAAQLANDQERAGEILAEALARDGDKSVARFHFPVLMGNRIEELLNILGQNPGGPVNQCFLLLALGRLEDARRLAAQPGNEALMQRFPRMRPAAPQKDRAEVAGKKTSATEFIEAIRNEWWGEIHRMSLCRTAEKIDAGRAEAKARQREPQNMVAMPFPSGTPGHQLFGMIAAANPEASTLSVMQRVSSFLYIDAPMEPVRSLIADGTGSPLKPKDMPEADWLELIARICWSKGLEKEAVDYLHRAIAAGGCPLSIARTILLTALPEGERIPMARLLARR
ncbi:MAG: hypothetical protein KAI66_17470, partial [Lentisphaeria bacterium]|nr:hypothetical protein [Lentisphaeria bacterium]